MFGDKTTDYVIPATKIKTEITDPNELASYALNFLQCNLDFELCAELTGVDVDEVDESELDRLYMLIDDAMNHIGEFTKKEKPQTKPQPKKIDNKTFVLAWIDSKSIQQLAQKLGIERTTAYSTATKLRNAGVQLPELQDSEINF